MSMLDDPSMKEVVDEFCSESLVLLEELDSELDTLEDDPSNSVALEKFGQIIDRIMGSAATLGVDEVASFCDLGKKIGYKASQVADIPLLEVVTAVLFDAVNLIKMMIKNIESGLAPNLEGLNTKAFGTRLKWLSEKFKNIERSSCGFTEDQSNDEDLGQNDIDSLMESLGL